MGTIKHIFKFRGITSIISLIALYLLVGGINPAFLNINNIFLTLNGSVVYIVLSLAIAFVLFTGEIDVSIGATLGLAAVTSAMLIRDGMSPVLALVISMGIGALIGMVNAFGVTIFKIPSIIMTLGVNGIVRGLIYIVTKGAWIENLPFEFKQFSQKNIFMNLNVMFVAILVLAIMIHFVISYWKKARYFLAVGDNSDGARLVGISVEKTRFVAFILCGVVAAVGGFIYASRVGFVTPPAGIGYEMKAIAACVLGGISLTGGVGNIIGATTGAIIMGSISKILVFLGFSSNYDNTITGILLIVIVVIDALSQRYSIEKSRKMRLMAKTSSDEVDVKKKSTIKTSVVET